MRALFFALAIASSLASSLPGGDVPGPGAVALAQPQAQIDRAGPCASMGVPSAGVTSLRLGSTSSGTAIMGHPPTNAAPAGVLAGRGCAVIADVSGSTSDYPSTRAWLISRLEQLLAAYGALASVADVTVIVYGDEARAVRVSPGSGSADWTPADIITAVTSSMGSKEWTNPLAALRWVIEEDGIPCVLNLTDGTLDPPPGAAPSPDAYVAGILATADELSRRRIPVTTIALTDDAGDLWRRVASRTGGAYLIDPHNEALRNTLAATVPTPEPTPTPTPSPSPPPAATPVPSATPNAVLTPEASPSPQALTAPSVGTGMPRWLLALPVALLGLLLVGAWRLGSRGRPLVGRLALPAADGEKEIDLSRFRGGVTLGTKATVRVEGAGVRPRHARIQALADEGDRVSMVVRPVDGPLSVVRGHSVIRVILELPLEDGDVLALGETKVRFRMLLPAYL